MDGRSIVLPIIPKMCCRFSSVNLNLGIWMEQFPLENLNSLSENVAQAYAQDRQTADYCLYFQIIGSFPCCFRES